ncbi:Spherulation-specific family 4 [Alternaria alternata]|nr:Spherulation-specific family 4 [Alternaria alternata]
MSQFSQSKVLLPLYIYPQVGAWDPLYTAVAANPCVRFVVIINPNSGPGAAPWWPNEDYVREIARLNALPNVTTLGYVRVAYCRRPVQDVLEDIETYGRRAREDDRLRVEGIFVDETVNLYSEEAKKYLDAIDRRARTLIGVMIHNPGTAVSAELAAPGPEITVVVETSYEEFMTEGYQEWLSTSPYKRARTAYIVHSVPQGEVKALTIALCERAEYLFVTSAFCGFYESFAGSWHDFVASLAERRK